MLEVVFSDSTKGAVRIAKREGLQGNARDIVNIGFALDIGSISGEYDGAERKTVLENLWGRFDFDSTELFFRNQRRDMNKLLAAAESGTPVRIWAGNAPYSLCGFHFVCHILRHIDCQLSVVKLPPYRIISENEMVSYTGWGEIEPSKFASFLPFEKTVTPIEKRMFADRWYELMTENAPLRAVINGKLMSVPENFYDYIITENIPSGEFCMANLIGGILGKYQLGISDCLIALRIDKMIENRQLVVIKEEKDHPYGKTLMPS